MDEGLIVADGPTEMLLGDDALLAAHRLELPRGFRVDAVARAASRVAVPK